MSSLEDVKRRLAQKILEEGGTFHRCANCGDIYPLPQEDWSDTTVCGERCFDDYVNYLNEELYG